MLLRTSTKEELCRGMGTARSRLSTPYKQMELGKKVSEVCREMGVSPQAFYRWKRRYGGLGLNEVRER
jgi:Transposase.